VKKMNELVAKAIIVPKKRKPTKISKAAKMKRLEGKKKAAEVKMNRKRVTVE